MMVMNSATQTIDSTTMTLAFMSPGAQKVLSDVDGVRVVLERSSVGRTGRVVRESAKGFQVLKSFTF